MKILLVKLKNLCTSACLKLNYCTAKHKPKLSLHGKPFFLFPEVLKRWSFQKNRAGIWSFLYYRERSCFFFPKIWSYTLDGKWKMIFLKKYTEIWYFLQTFWKDGLFKKGHAGTWSFLYYLERWYFFPKTWYFFLGQEERDDLSQEIHEYMIFSVYTYECYKRGVRPLSQKNSRMVLSHKNTPKGDWHFRLKSWKELQQCSVL